MTSCKFGGVWTPPPPFVTKITFCLTPPPPFVMQSHFLLDPPSKKCQAYFQCPFKILHIMLERLKKKQPIKQWVKNN